MLYFISFTCIYLGVEIKNLDLSVLKGTMYHTIKGDAYNILIVLK